MTFIRRLAQSITSLLAASLLIWTMMGLAPGDPATRILHARGVVEPSPQQIADMRASLMLDEPSFVRYFDWCAGLFVGDMGISWRTGQPVAEELLQRLPSTALLAGTALVLALVITVVVGGVAAQWQRRWPDHLSRGLTLLALSLPSFLIGVVLIDSLSLSMGWGAVIADGSVSTVLLPALALALGPAAAWSRLMRTSLIDAQEAPFLLVAAGRGASSWYLFSRHLLLHTVSPLLTVVGLSAAALLGGAPVVETVFSWPGIGQFTVQAIEARDLPVVAGATMMGVIIYLVVSFITDLALFAIDPRRELTS